MSVDFNYFSTTQPDALSLGMTAIATTVTLVDGSTFPDPSLYGGKPYTVIIGFGTSREEVCTVTAKPSANTLTVTRGQDGTPASIKNAGDVVVHGVSAREFNALSGKLDTAGGTMTGALQVLAPVGQSDAATKKYADDLAALKVNKAGDTMTGALTLPAAPTANLHASTKKYVDDSMPLGAIIMYPGVAAPTGWHLCDGTAHGSSALQALIGSANTPDFRDRFIVAAGSSYAVGATGGADTVTLTADQSGVAAHSHTITVNAGGNAHTHSINHDHPAATSTSAQPAITMSFQSGGESGDSLPGTAVGYLTTGTGEGAGGTPLTASQPAHSHTVDLPAFTGTSGATADSHSHTATAAAATATPAAQAHENRPPYYALTFIIKKA